MSLSKDKQENLPIAVGRVGKDDIQPGRQQLGLDELLVNIPGLFFQNRYNFMQDLRISIRGFDARASFGIRGIGIYADGIPLILADGQGSVDAIDLGSAERIEVIRGPFSSVYGTASGGVINITTKYGTEIPYESGRINAGSYGFVQGADESRRGSRFTCGANWQNTFFMPCFSCSELKKRFYLVWVAAVLGEILGVQN